MDLPNKSRMTWSTMTSQICYLVSGNLYKPLMHDTGNDAVKFPMKPEHPDLPETSPNRSPTLKSDNKSGKGSSHSKQKNTNSSSTQNKGSTTERKPTTPDLSSKLSKDRKLTPQERQCRLENKLCLFCGASGHVAKDCPKSTSASSKARASKTEQDKSVSTGSDSKKY